MLIYATKQQGGNSSLATAGLTKLKTAYSVFVDNKQQYPLVYDLSWRGLVSSATYVNNDPMSDFGNALYKYADYCKSLQSDS
jgi:endo-1,3(4)-beta-glucanase